VLLLLASLSIRLFDFKMLKLLSDRQPSGGLAREIRAMVEMAGLTLQCEHIDKLFQQMQRRKDQTELFRHAGFQALLRDATISVGTEVECLCGASFAVSKP